MNGIVDVGGGVVGHFPRHSGRQLLLDLIELDASAFDYIQRIGIRQHPDTHEHGFLSGEAHLCVVVFCAENDVSDIAEPNQRVLILPDDQLLELLRRVQIGVCRQADLKKRAFGISNGRQKVVLRQDIADLRRADVQRSHPVRFHPDAHGKSAAAKNVRFLHSRNCGQTWLHEADQIIGHLVRLENGGCKAEISGSELGIGRLNRNYWNLRFRRQIVANRVNSRADIRQRLVRVVIQFETRSDK